MNCRSIGAWTNKCTQRLDTKVSVLLDIEPENLACLLLLR